MIFDQENLSDEIAKEILQKPSWKSLQYYRATFDENIFQKFITNQEFRHRSKTSFS